MPVHDDGGRVRSYNRDYPDQLSMVLETGDGGRQDIEDVAHHEPPPVEFRGRRERWGSRRR